MTKAELIKRITATAKTTQKETENVLNAALATMHDSLAAGENIVFLGFGTFGVKMRAARHARNLNTQQMIALPETQVVYFKMGNKLKEAVAKVKSGVAVKPTTAGKKAAAKRKKQLQTTL